MNQRNNTNKMRGGKSVSFKKILGAIVLPLLLISALTTGAIFQTATAQGATSYYGYITGIEKQAQLAG